MYQQLLSDMKLMMGLGIEKELVIKDSISDKSVFAETGSVDIHNRIDWLILQKQGELQELDVKQKKAGYFPVLAFNAIYNQDYWWMNFDKLGTGSYWYSSSYLNITLDVPIFEGFKKKSQIAQSTISLNEIRNRQSLLSATFNKEISDARNKLINSLVRLESQNKNLKLADDVYQTTILEYKEGTANLSDLLNSENSLLESQTQYMSAIADKLLAELSLQKAKGILLQSFETSSSK
jgi:outer membrane protein TolC